MLFPKENEVFYNKVQVLNRDLSIMMLRLFAERRLRDKEAKLLKREGLTLEQVTAQLADVDWTKKVAETAAEDGLVVLDALAASGLRSIRYFKEVTGVKKVIVNDLEEAAVEQAHRNVAYNNVDPTRVVPQQGNANLGVYLPLETLSPPYLPLFLSSHTTADSNLSSASERKDPKQAHLTHVSLPALPLSFFSHVSAHGGAEPSREGAIRCD